MKKSYIYKPKITYNKYQSGFRTKHSTDTCLSLLNNKMLTGIDNRLLTGMILIDIQKLFIQDHEFFSPKYIFWVLVNLQFIGTNPI